MLTSYSKASNHPIDVQLENILVDTIPSKVGSFKLSLPVAIRGIGKPVEKILLEAAVAHSEPREKLRSTLSVNGIVITREIRPARSVEVDGVYWSTEVFDATQLLRNKLRRLFQVVKIYVNGSEVERIGHLTLMVIYRVGDALSSLDYLVGPHLMEENSVMKFKVPYTSNYEGFNKPYFLHKTLVYSPMPRGKIWTRIGSYEYMLPKRAGYTEISYERPVNSGSLEVGNNEGKTLLFNSFTLHAYYRVPLISMAKYNVTEDKSKDTVDLGFDIRLSSCSTTEGLQAQFIIIGEGTPLGRITRKLDPEKEAFSLYFKGLPRISEYTLRVVLSKYSKTWIQDFPIRLP